MFIEPFRECGPKVCEGIVHMRKGLFCRKNEVININRTF